MAYLALLNDLKVLLKQTSTDNDARLGLMLKTATAQIEQYCDHTLLYAAGVETLDGGASWLLLDRYPVVSVASVIESAGRDWSGATPLVEGDDFLVRADRGRLIRLPDETLWIDGSQTVRVDYAGGYVDPAVVSLPDGASYAPEHLQSACLMQAMHLWQRHQQLGQASVSPVTGGGAGGGVVFTTGEYGLLKEVMAMVDGERRL